MSEEGYGPLRQYPLRLTRGDILVSLTDLANSPDTFDAETENIRICFQHSPGAQRTVEAVRLLQHAACSTGLNEQGRGPTRLLHKQHDQLEIESARLLAYARLHTPFCRLSNAGLRRTSLWF